MLNCFHARLCYTFQAYEILANLPKFSTLLINQNICEILVLIFVKARQCHNKMTHQWKEK